MLKKVYIVTVVYSDPKDQFRSFIKSLKKIRDINFSVIIINNNAKTTWLSEICEKYSNILVVESKINIGFCAGSNLGIKKALSMGAEYILLLNGDTEVYSNVLSEMIEYSTKYEIGILSPIILSADRKSIFYAGGVISKLFGYTRQPAIGKEYSNFIYQSGPTGYAIGCCMLIQANVFEKIGFLDKDYFMYFDDPDFSLRAKKANFKVHLLAKPLVYHINSSNKLGENAAYYYGRNPFLLIRKFFPWYFWPTAFFGQFLIRLPRNIFRLKNKDAFKNYLLGIYHGLIGKIGRKQSS